MSIARLIREKLNEAVNPQPLSILVTTIANDEVRYKLFTKGSTKKTLNRKGDDDLKSLEDLNITYKKGDVVKLDGHQYNSRISKDIEITGVTKTEYTAKEI